MKATVSGNKILIVDDEVAIRDMLRMALELSDFECIEAGDILDAHRRVVDERPDVILLDWMLPGGSGLELLRRLKRSDTTAGIPVIMLTAKTTQDNVIQGLEVGADDYITKPFAPRELIARIKALMRRASGADKGESLTVDDLVVDLASHRVSVGGRTVDMGPTEFNLLRFFMTHPERAYTRSQVLDHVWGTNVYLEESTIDVHIRRLRKALQTPEADYSDLIQTVRGTGYRFSVRDRDST